MLHQFRVPNLERPFENSPQFHGQCFTFIQTYKPRSGPTAPTQTDNRRTWLQHPWAFPVVMEDPSKSGRSLACECGSPGIGSALNSLMMRSRSAWGVSWADVSFWRLVGAIRAMATCKQNTLCRTAWNIVIHAHNMRFAMSTSKTHATFTYGLDTITSSQLLATNWALYTTENPWTDTKPAQCDPTGK